MVDNVLTSIPALIDPHVHFRTPGVEHKEDWRCGARAAIAGGVTTVFDMPNHRPNCTTLERLLEKKKIIDSQLKEVGIPLRYHLYLGAEKTSLDEIPKGKNSAIGIKLFMGSSTGTLLMDDPDDLKKLFALAAQYQMMVSVHAEDEKIIRLQSEKYSRGEGTSACLHSIIRNEEAAISAVSKAIALAEEYGTKLCILHVSTEAELKLIAAAKKRGVKVFAEVTPHHLFFDQEDYARQGTRVVMNPPLRTPRDREALWEGIRNGTVDFLGTDHAPHLLTEKSLPYGQAPSGVPGIEFLMPLMLTAIHDGFLTLSQLLRISRDNIIAAFGLEENDDTVLVDMELCHQVEQDDVVSKCGWTPYEGKILRGWPVYVIINNQKIATGRGKWAMC